MPRLSADASIQQSIERPISFSPPLVNAILAGSKTQTRRAVVPTPDVIKGRRSSRSPLHHGKPIRCRFGEVGDRLWVRERWATDANGAFVYAASAGRREIYRWRPSYMMPRAACRMVLEITSLRSERLRDITPADARAEGFPNDPPTSGPVVWFRDLWDSLCNAEHRWKANPWVWVIGFG